MGASLRQRQKRDRPTGETQQPDLHHHWRHPALVYGHQSIFPPRHLCARDDGAGAFVRRQRHALAPWLSRLRYDWPPAARSYGRASSGRNQWHHARPGANLSRHQQRHGCLCSDGIRAPPGARNSIPGGADGIDGAGIADRMRQCGRLADGAINVAYARNLYANRGRSLAFNPRTAAPDGERCARPTRRRMWDSPGSCLHPGFFGDATLLARPDRA